MPELDPYQGTNLPDRFLRYLATWRQKFIRIPTFSVGDGTPEGSINGKIADRYFNRTGAAGTFMYVKTSNGGNTGWIAYA